MNIWWMRGFCFYNECSSRVIAGIAAVVVVDDAAAVGTHQRNE